MKSIIFITILFLIGLCYGDTKATFYMTVNPASNNSNCVVNPSVDCQDIYSSLLAYYKVQNSSTTLELSLKEGTYTGVNNTNLMINNASLTIQTYGLASVTIDLQYNGNFITIPDSNFATVLKLSSLNIINGNSIFGAVLNINTTYAYNVITLTNVVAQNNIAQYGGVFYISAGSNVVMTVTNTQFINNTAYIHGAVFYSQSSSTIYFYNSVFNNNKNTSLIYAVFTTMLLNNSTINNNIGNATLMAFAYATTTINGLTFNNNQMLINGASFIKFLSQTVQITNATYEANTVGTVLRYLNSYGNPLSISNSLFNKNVGSQYGAIYIDPQSSIKVDNTNFTNNIANNNGTAIYFENSSTLARYASYVNNVVFSNNTVTGNNGVAVDIYAKYVNLNLNGITFLEQESLTVKPIYCYYSIVNFNQVTSNYVNVMSCYSDSCTVKGDLAKYLCGGEDSSGEKSKKSLTSGQVAGIVIGVLIGIAVVILVVYILYKRHHNRHKYQSYH